MVLDLKGVKALKYHAVPTSLVPVVEERRIPEELGKYKIIQRLAIGGMAELFLARVTGLEGFEKYVAIKRILPLYAEDSHFVDMFLDEARLAARLDHQNIVQVHDIGQDDGAYFFAMEYLHGEDAQELLKAESDRHGHIPLEQALTIITGVAAGLQYAHEKRDNDGLPLHIVHRDVAPSNIIITYDGGVKLVDFGIARAHFRRSQTEAGRVKGKLSYMSPEQCRGEELDARSDIFALGIVMYELTTMSRLFRVRRSNKLEVMERIVKGDIMPPSARVPDYPAPLEAIVMRALRTSRKQRYQTAGELLHDLEEFAKQSGLSLSSQALARYLRETIGYRPEPWRVDRVDPPTHDSGKIRGATGESRLPLHLREAGGQTSVPTPSRPSQVVSGAITAKDLPAHKANSHPVLRKRRRRVLAAIVALAALAALAVAMLYLNSEAESQNNLPGVTAGSPGDSSGDTPDNAALGTDSGVDQAGDSTAESSDKSTTGDSTRKRRRDRKSRSEKKSSSSKDRTTDSKKTEPSGKDRNSSTSKNTGTATSKKGDSTSSDDSRKTTTVPASNDTGKTTSDSKTDKDPKERKKWDPNNPFPPSANE